MNPNEVCEHPVQIKLPLNPTKSSEPVETGMGVIGLMKGGGFLFNHLSAPGDTDNVAAVLEAPSLDTCGGHAAPGCIYHFHSFNTHDQCTHDGKWDECEWIGTLLDGFKLYSHCKLPDSETYLKSCYQLISDGDTGSTSSYEHV